MEPGVLRHFTALPPEPNFPAGLNPVALPTPGTTQPKPVKSGGHSLPQPAGCLHTVWKKLSVFEDKSFEEGGGKRFSETGQDEKVPPSVAGTIRGHVLPPKSPFVNEVRSLLHIPSFSFPRYRAPEAGSKDHYQP